MQADLLKTPSVIRDNNSFTSSFLFDSLGNVRVPASLCPFASFGPSSYSCNASSLIRSYDGSCNNLNSPWYGSINTPYNRFIPAQYQDSIGSPRNRSVTGALLPNPRLISLAVDLSSNATLDVNAVLTYFSQFVAHDISLIAVTPGMDGLPKACQCNTSDPDCINIPSVMNFNGNTSVDGSQQCEVTPRSLGVYTTMKCIVSSREQVNSVTGWLDLSQIYGISRDQSASLRLFENGLLNSSFINSGNDGHASENLPFAGPDVEQTCANKNSPCFLSGDRRLHINQLLLGFHTLYLREHNRIARQLAIVNPHMSDEDLFELTRRINIANYQNMVYFDWLLVLISPNRNVFDKNLMAFLNVNNTSFKNDPDGYSYGYNSSLYPQIYNEFVTAAYRFGHSMVSSSFNKYNRSMDLVQKAQFSSSILNSSEAFYGGGIDGAIRAALFQYAPLVDLHLTETITNSLFLNNSPGLETTRYSLAALNINRNRDHGLQGYVAYLELLGYPSPRSFSDLSNIPAPIQQTLAKVYDDVKDIELWVGGLAETPIQSGYLGPTFASKVKEFLNYYNPSPDL
jgi:peroxidase